MFKILISHTDKFLRWPCYMSENLFWKLRPRQSKNALQKHGWITWRRRPGWMHTRHKTGRVGVLRRDLSPAVDAYKLICVYTMWYINTLGIPSVSISAHIFFWFPYIYWNQSFLFEILYHYFLKFVIIVSKISSNAVYVFISPWTLQYRITICKILSF